MAPPDQVRKAIEDQQRLDRAYREGGRRAECPDEDATLMHSIEVDFAIPVLMTQDQQRRLLAILNEIIDSPWNEPVEGVHWMAGVGSKMRWSRHDAALLGKPAEPGAPESGPPTYDDSVYHVESCARAFGSDEERRNVMRRRQREPKA